MEVRTVARRNRANSQAHQHEAIQKLGERIAEVNRLPKTSIRYAEYVFFRRDGWTIEAGWEQWIGDQWQPMADLGIAQHSSPPTSLGNRNPQA